MAKLVYIAAEIYTYLIPRLMQWFADRSRDRTYNEYVYTDKNGVLIENTPLVHQLVPVCQTLMLCTIA